MPPSISAGDVVAIISINDPRVSTHVRQTPTSNMRLVRQWSTRTKRMKGIGCHVFLLQTEGKFGYTLRRSQSFSALDAIDDY